MFLFICILIGVLAAICIALVIYLIYCIIGISAYINQHDGLYGKITKNTIKSNKWFNIPLHFTLKAFDKAIDRSTSSSIDGSNLKRALKAIQAWIVGVVISILQVAVILIALCAAVYALSSAFNAAASLYNTLFSKADSCYCYVRCSGDSEDDAKTAYELLFGPDEYKQLLHDAKFVGEEANYFNTLTDGKSKGEFLRDRINEYMIADYRAIVGNHKGFRDSDGKDRTIMSDDQLREDLYLLLSDYKVNGKNPECDCDNYTGMELTNKCWGEKKYKPDVSWESIWGLGDDNQQIQAPATGYVPGMATGQFAIALNDGNFYWYHQSGACQCANNFNHPTYGRVGSISTPGGTMAARGCSMYSMAIALSNLLGEEITVDKIITDVLKSSIESQNTGTYGFRCSSPVLVNTNNIVVFREDYAKAINDAYGDKGIEAVFVSGFTQENINKYLDDNEYYTYIWNSWSPRTSDDAFKIYSGNGHYMIIRSHESDGTYKMFTSTGSSYGSSHDAIIEHMNLSYGWDVLNKYKSYNSFIVIRRKKSLYTASSTSNNGMGGTASGTVGYNQEVYDILNNSAYRSKAKALATVYAVCEQKYGKNFTLGLMANIYGEGNVGYIEGYFSLGKVNGFAIPSGGSKIKTLADINYLLAWPSSSADKSRAPYTNSKGKTSQVRISSCGIGIIQWSFERRVTCCNNYLNYIKSDADVTDDNLFLGELSTMQAELDSGHWVKPADYANATPEECSTVLTKKYEVPADTNNEATKRAGYATDLKNLLAGVTTSGATAGGSTNAGAIPSGGNNTSSSNDKGQQVVDYARQFIGNHYVYSGNTITCTDWTDSVGIDCSHFVCTVYQQFGELQTYLTSSELRSAGTAVTFKNSEGKYDTSQMKAGDIVCYSGHVAIYNGNGGIVHASGSASGIKESSNWAYRDVITVRRIFQ